MNEPLLVRVRNILILVGYFSLIAVPSAHAYVDPGTGTLVWQLALSVMVGGVFWFRKSIRLIQGGIQRLFHKKGKF